MKKLSTPATARLVSNELMERPLYDGKELRPFEGRVGAMDAYKLPSLRGGKAIAPSLYMRRNEGVSK